MSDPVQVKPDDIMQFFEYAHLPEKLQVASKPFSELAQSIVRDVPRNPERTMALRKLLEAKDCAVRALLFKTLAVLALCLPSLAHAADVPAPVSRWFQEQVLLPLLLAAVTALAGLAARLVANTGGYLRTKIASAILDQVVTRFELFADGTVHQLEATLRQALANERGKLDPEAVTRIRAAALARMKQLAGEEGLVTARAVLGLVGDALEEWLSGLLERALKKMHDGTVQA